MCFKQVLAEVNIGSDNYWMKRANVKEKKRVGLRRKRSMCFMTKQWQNYEKNQFQMLHQTYISIHNLNKSHTMLCVLGREIHRCFDCEKSYSQKMGRGNEFVISRASKGTLKSNLIFKDLFKTLLKYKTSWYIRNFTLCFWVQFMIMRSVISTA